MKSGAVTGHSDEKSSSMHRIVDATYLPNCVFTHLLRGILVEKRSRLLAKALYPFLALFPSSDMPLLSINQVSIVEQILELLPYLIEALGSHVWNEWETSNTAVLGLAM